MSVEEGTVTSVDRRRGVALVALSCGGDAEIHAGAFFSGRPGRLPAVGDRVVVRMRGEVAVISSLASDSVESDS